jgi:hypothetical protein
MVPNMARTRSCSTSDISHYMSRGHVQTLAGGGLVGGGRLGGGIGGEGGTPPTGANVMPCDHSKSGVMMPVSPKPILKYPLKLTPPV